MDEVAIKEALQKLNQTINNLIEAKTLNELVYRIKLQEQLNNITEKECIHFLVQNILFPQLNQLTFHLNQNKQNKDDKDIMISVQHSRVIYSSLELLWHWALKDTLHQISSFKLSDGNGIPRSMLITKKTLELGTSSLGNESLSLGIKDLFGLIECVYKVITDDNFSNMMLQRNLDRVLLSLFSLSNDEILLGFYRKNEKYTHNISEEVEEIKSKSIVLIKSLLELPFQHVLVNALRPFLRVNIVQNPPTREVDPKSISSDVHTRTDSSWLRERACEMLSTILLQPEGRGVEAVLAGFLQGIVEGPNVDKAFLFVSRLILSVPKNMEKDTYFANICRQLLVLLGSGVQRNDVGLLRLCTLMVGRLSQISPKICFEYVIKPLALAVNPKTYEKSIDRANFSIKTSVQILSSLLISGPVVSKNLVKLINYGKIGENLVKLFFFLSPIIEEKEKNLLIEEQKKCDYELCFIALRDFLGSYLKNCEVFNAIEIIEKVLYCNEKVFILSENDDIEFFDNLEKGEEGKSPNNLDFKENDLFNNIINSVKGNKKLENNFLIEEKNIKMEAKAETMLKLLQLLENTENEVKIDILETGEMKTENEKSEEKLVYSISSEVFLRVLKRFLSPENEGFDDFDTRGLNGLIVSKLLENQSKTMNLFQKGVQILRLMNSIIENYAERMKLENKEIAENENQKTFTEKGKPFIQEIGQENENEENEKNLDLLQLCLEFLLNFLPSIDKKSEENKILTGLIEPLQFIHFRETENKTENKSEIENSSVSTLINEIIINIVSRSVQENKKVSLSTNMGRKGKINIFEGFRRKLCEIERNCFQFSEGISPSPSNRVYGIHLINLLVKEFFYNHIDIEDSPVTKEEENTFISLVLSLYLDQLQETESFVYLSSLSAIRHLANYQLPLVFQTLTMIYSGDNTDLSLETSLKSNEFRNIFSRVNTILLPIRRKILVGEGLILILQSFSQKSWKIRKNDNFETLDVLLPRLVNNCLKIIKMKPTEEMIENVEKSIKLVDKPEFLDINPVEKEEKAILADSVLLRQSALSVLNEVLLVKTEKTLSLTNGSNIRFVDILDVIEGILRREKGFSQVEITSRRGAAYLLVQILDCLLIKTLWEMDEIHVGYLKSTMRVLRATINDQDDIVKLHISNGLALLDNQMRTQLSLAASVEDVGKFYIEADKNDLEFLKIV